MISQILGYLTSFQPSNVERRCIIDDLKLDIVCFNTKSWYVEGLRKMIKILSEKPVFEPRLETGT
jgi:hypothetical protein